MRILLAHILSSDGIDVVGEAANAEETVTQWRELRPDVIVLDQRMPPTTGLEVAETILTDAPEQVIFLFTALVDRELRSEAERLGIAACIAKDQLFEIPDLVRAHLNPG